MTAKTLVVGGGSRLAAALRRQFPGSYCYLARTRAGSGTPASIRSIAAYEDLSAQDMAGYSTVINLVGTTSGTEEDLMRVNAALPAHIAEQAARAGVSRFIAVSSFSVFGNARVINASSATDPTSAYGRSRLAGEARISRYSDAMECIIARKPMLYGAGDSKLERLITHWRSVRVMPTPPKPVSRSMLHYDLAARYLDQVAHWQLTAPGLVYHYIADPVAFEYRMAARIISEVGDRTIYALTLPSFAFQFFGAVSPQLSRSLFDDSVLDAADNFFKDPEVSRLERDLADMASQRKSFL